MITIYMYVCRYNIYWSNVKISRNKSLNENGERAMARWMVIARKKAKKMRLRETRASRAPRNTWIFTGTREKFTSCRPQRLSIELQRIEKKKIWSLLMSVNVRLYDEGRGDMSKSYVTTVSYEWKFISPRAIWG